VRRRRLGGDGDFDFDTGFDVDDDLLDNFGWGVEVNESLVDSHLEHIPGLRTFTTRSLSGSDLEALGWQTNWALDTEFLGLGAVNEFLADLLEGCDLLGCKGDSDAVGFWAFTKFLLSFVVRHDDLWDWYCVLQDSIV